MRIVLLDDSVTFDATTPATRPLGGAEKAFAALPGALARRGHDVTVINNCPAPATLEGARWLTWTAARPESADVLIASRKAGLLETLPKATHRLLWVMAPATYLDKGPNRRRLNRTKPTLVFQGERHRDGWTPWKSFRRAVVPPGVTRPYLEAEAPQPARPPRAVVTAHPRHDVAWLLDVWRDHVVPRVPDAALHLYSGVLTAAEAGREAPPEDLRPVLAKARETPGVVLCQPQGDRAMAEAYRAARVHLHPGVNSDVLAGTVADSQAVGCPAAGRPHGALPERVRNGQTGFLVPDAEALGNVAVQLLTDDATYDAMSRDARHLQAGRDWDVVAAEFEPLWQQR